MADLPLSLAVAGRTFPVEYKRSRGRSSSVRIRNGKVIIRLASGKILGHERTVLSFLAWAQKKLSVVPEFLDFRMPKYLDGESIVTHNKIYELSIGRRDVSRVRCVIEDSYRIVLTLPLGYGGDFSVLIDHCIIKDQMPYLGAVLNELNALHFQERIVSYSFKRMNSRFGSCSSRRKLNLAYSLLFAPRFVFHYVCVHELAHLKEMNHSRRFWDLVVQAMPDYKEAERWLKEMGYLLG